MKVHHRILFFLRVYFQRTFPLLFCFQPHCASPCNPGSSFTSSSLRVALVLSLSCLNIWPINFHFRYLIPFQISFRLVLSHGYMINLVLSSIIWRGPRYLMTFLMGKQITTHCQVKIPRRVKKPFSITIQISQTMFSHHHVCIFIFIS
jgi:hypothetical protein